MTKKIKFPLIMKDNIPVRTIEELREHFDLAKAVEYFLNGKLKTWLEQRYYDSEAAAVNLLEEHDPDLHQKLCDTLGVEYKSEDIKFDVDFVKDRARRLAELKQYTSDSTILSEVDNVAFNQEELAYLLDEGVHDIYLCNNTFTIPLRVTKKKYIGIGKAVAVIHSKDEVDFWLKDIEFVNVEFDDEYEKIHNPSPERLYQMGLEAEKSGELEKAWMFFIRASNAGNSNAMNKIGEIYDDINLKISCGNYSIARDAELDLILLYDHGNRYDFSSLDDMLYKRSARAIQYFKKAASLGNAKAMFNLSGIYFSGRYGKILSQNSEEGERLLTKAIEKNCTDAMSLKATMCIYGGNVNEGIKWYEQSAKLGDTKAMRELADIYYKEEISRDIWDYSKAEKWYKTAAIAGDVAAMKSLGELYSNLINDYEKAYFWYKKAIDHGDIFSGVCCVELINSTHLNMYKNQDEKKEDIEKIYMKLGDNTRLGYFYKDRKRDGDLDRALACFEKEVERGQFSSYESIGDIYKLQNKVDKSIVAYQKCISYLEEETDEYKRVKEKLNNAKVDVSMKRS